MIYSSVKRLFRMGAPGGCSTQEPTFTLDQLAGTGSIGRLHRLAISEWYKPERATQGRRDSRPRPPLTATLPPLGEVILGSLNLGRA